MLKDSNLDSLNERNFRPSVPDELPEQCAEQCSGPSYSGLDSAPEQRSRLRSSTLGRLIEPSFRPIGLKVPAY
jgi:hypothetical protein